MTTQLTIRRGDVHQHPAGGDWPHGDDCADRWYIDAANYPIDHRGPGYATRREARVEAMARRWRLSWGLPATLDEVNQAAMLEATR